MNNKFYLVSVAIVLALAGCGQTATQPITTTSTPYSVVQIAAHSTPSDCWMAIDGTVYDATKFIPNHPGGDQILQGCGKDATSLFNQVRKHSGGQTQSLLPQFAIGNLIN